MIGFICCVVPFQVTNQLDRETNIDEKSGVEFRSGSE